jgi:hypothetical protein
MADHMLDATTYATPSLKDLPMGCDIHWYSETYRNGAWQCDQAASLTQDDENEGYLDMDNFPGRERDYWLFGLLNQVRSSWDWSFPAQEALPEDASPQVQALYQQWGSDAHSAGALTRAELQAKLAELTTLRARELLVPGSTWAPVLASQAAQLDAIVANLNADVPATDQRIVFWFDN